MSSDYHRDYDHVSKSMLSTLISHGAEEYHRRYILREPYDGKRTDEMDLGSIVDRVVTEGKDLREVAIVYPDNVLDARGGVREKAREWAANQSHEFVVKPGLYRKAVQAITTAETAMAEGLIDQAWQGQIRFDAAPYGVPCKCLCDLVNEDRTEIVDLKCMADISPRGFIRSAKAFHYWLQAVHYAALVQIHTAAPKPPSFKFLCIDTANPGRYQWYWFDEETLTRGGDRHMELLEEIQQRTAAGNWATDWNPEVHLAPWDIDPDYSRKQNEEVVFDG